MYQHCSIHKKNIIIQQEMWPIIKNKSLETDFKLTQIIAFSKNFRAAIWNMS